MRILHVIESLDPSTGGTGAVATRLAAAQAGQGQDVRILSYAGTEAKARIALSLARVPHADRIDLRYLPPPTLAERFCALQGRAELQRLLADAEVLHLHGVWGALLRVAAKDARRRQRPYFLCPSGMLDPWSLAQRRWKKRLALVCGYRAMLNGAAALHLLNEDEQRLIQPLRLRAPQIILPNGVFLEEIEPLPPPGTFYARYPQLEKNPFILFLSRLHYKKGLDYLAGAFALFAKENSRAHLVVAGPDGGAQQPFERDIQRAGLEQRVHLTGPLYGEAKLAALGDATCFCLPSRQEGFSVAILEALACRLPVIISPDCHFPEVATAGAGEIVARETRAVAGAFGRLFADANTRQQMGAAGRRLVEAHYVWPRVAEACIAAYHDALHESQR